MHIEARHPITEMPRNYGFKTFLFNIVSKVQVYYLNLAQSSGSMLLSEKDLPKER